LNEIILLADIEDVIGGLMALLVPLLWVIKQIADATKQGKAGEAAQPVAPQQPPPQPARRPAGQQADPLRNQVEEFLRRAGRGPQGERPRPAPRDIEVLVDAPAAASPRATTSPSLVIPSEQPAQRRSVAPRKRKSLAERATERAAARASRLAEQTSQLGQRIIEEDQQFDVQLRAKFDHTVGTLTGETAAVVEKVAIDTPAGQIAAMLASPDGVRQAIVVNEILRRPVDRW
jgi:hypothetical protein